MAQLVLLDVPVHWRVQIQRLAPKVRAQLGEPARPVVEAIYINQTGKKATTHKVEDWLVPGLTRHHDGAWPLALDLYEEGWISRQQLAQTCQRMQAQGITPEAMQRSAQEAAQAGWLRQETLAAQPCAQAPSAP